MARKKKVARRPEAEQPLPDAAHAGGPPTTGGSIPGGAPTGLRHQTDMLGLGGGMGGSHTGGMLPTGASGGTGTGAGGLGTGPAGIGGTRNLPHGAGRPSYGPAPRGERAGGLETTDTALPGARADGAVETGEAGSRGGNAGIEPNRSPAVSIRGAGSGRR
jgi:hypothetical protein